MNKAKLIFCTLIICFHAHLALSDICYDITDNDVITKATDILNQQNEIYDYCSVCMNAEPRKIIIHEIKAGNPILINQQGIDLAHIYYKDGSDFVNLGIASGCFSANEYGIKEKLEKLPIIQRTPESDKTEAEQKAQIAYDTCVEQYKTTSEHLTTADMVARNTLINDCLTTKIKQEISIGFTPQVQEEMNQYLAQIRKNTLDFYSKFYAENKYCDNKCGTMADILPFTNEGNTLLEILTQLFYLNITKKGY